MKYKYCVSFIRAISKILNYFPDISEIERNQSSFIESGKNTMKIQKQKIKVDKLISMDKLLFLL